MLTLTAEAKIKILMTDVDGCMTDGGMYFGPDGQAIKRFDAKDGYGLKMLQRSGVMVAWVTTDDSAITRSRFEALRLDLIRNGCPDKKEGVQSVLAEAGCEAEEAVYVGDDLSDLAVLGQVATFIAPADAVQEVREKADAVTSAPGGHGAIREICEAIIEHNQALQ